MYMSIYIKMNVVGICTHFTIYIIKNSFLVKSMEFKDVLFNRLYK